MRPTLVGDEHCVECGEKLTEETVLGVVIAKGRDMVMVSEYADPAIIELWCERCFLGGTPPKHATDREG